MKISYTALQSADPGAQIVLGGLFARPKGAARRTKPKQAYCATDFLEQMYETTPGIKTKFNGVALHPYTATYQRTDRRDRRIPRSPESQRRCRQGPLDHRARLELAAGHRRATSSPKAPPARRRSCRGAFSLLRNKQVKWKLQRVYWFSVDDAAGACNFCDGSGLFAQASCRRRPGTPSSSSPAALRRPARPAGLRKIGGLATEAKASAKSDPLAPFSAPVRRWFEASFEGPTPAQAGGWEAISGGDNALICAPTGSGKTLASFLWGIDKLARCDGQQLGTGVRLVYVSPLKALSYDIERNLRAPLRGIGADISVGLRTGDTSQKERRAMAKTPPDILITTPESLYLMLSSSVREILATTEAVIVDEIHAVAQTKRGAHLALTLERLDAGAGPGVGGAVAETAGNAERPVLRSGIQRIGLSATQRPLERIAQVPGRSKRECRDRRCGAEEGARPGDRRAGRGHGGSGGAGLPERGRPATDEVEPSAHIRSIWPAIYPKLLKLVQEHTSTIIFVNNRRASERLAKRLNELANGEGEQELPATEHAGHGGRGGERRGRTRLRNSGEAQLSPPPTLPTSRSRARITGRCRTRRGRSSRRC